MRPRAEAAANCPDSVDTGRRSRESGAPGSDKRRRIRRAVCGRGCTTAEQSAFRRSRCPADQSLSCQPARDRVAGHRRSAEANEPAGTRHTGDALPTSAMAAEFASQKRSRPKRPLPGRSGKRFCAASILVWILARRSRAASVSLAAPLVPGSHGAQRGKRLFRPTPEQRPQWPLDPWRRFHPTRANSQSARRCRGSMHRWPVCPGQRRSGKRARARLHRHRARLSAPPLSDEIAPNAFAIRCRPMPRHCAAAAPRSWSGRFAPPGRRSDRRIRGPRARRIDHCPGDAPLARSPRIKPPPTPAATPRGPPTDPSSPPSNPPPARPASCPSNTPAMPPRSTSSHHHLPGRAPEVQNPQCRPIPRRQ